MIGDNVFEVLLAPYVTEKSSMSSGELRQYVFKVATDATKHDIKGAVEKLFSVSVSHVRTCNVSGKKVRFGRTFGQRKSWKKAYVTLSAGQEIDLSEQ